MPALDSYEAHFQEVLLTRLREVIAEKTEHIVSGHARDSSDAAATAQNYSNAVGYLHALREVVDLCKSIEQDLIHKG